MERSLDINDKIQIRPLKKEDIPSILEIDSKITGTSRSSLDTEKLTYYLRNPLVCWGAESRGNLIGFMLGDIRGWEFGISESGWIEILGVDPAYQRKGVGRAILNAMLDELKKRGVKKVLIIARWYDPILSFFRGEGFEHGELLSVQKDLE
ncbi:MAG: GNAT family N-acetyltransferase [Dehalococcoidia bacterium]|nr:GNAT family N-acetyltransferase [Dehalococcoidia bacterium]